MKIIFNNPPTSFVRAKTLLAIPLRFTLKIAANGKLQYGFAISWADVQNTDVDFSFISRAESVAGV